MTTWDQNLQTINGLWPDASWTPEESSLYRERLRPMDQTWLEVAIKNVRIGYSASKPALKWLIDEYAKVKDGSTFRERIKERSDIMSEEGINQVEIEKMRKKLESLPVSEQLQVAERVRKACGMQLDFSTIESWSNFRIAISAAAIT